MEEIYLDSAATTKVLKEAALILQKCLLEEFANPSSLHSMGIRAEEIVNLARTEVANAMGCSSEEVLFTPSATFSSNLAIFGVAKKEKKRRTIISTKIEHAATARCLEELQRLGFNVVCVEPRNHEFYAEDFVNAVTEDTFLVSLIHVNNETGLILPVFEIAKEIKKKNKSVIVHVDAVQSFCKLPLKLDESEIDLASISGHKINAPKGVGGLFLKKGVKLAKILFGGQQEGGFVPGTQAVGLIAAFGVAARINSNRIESMLEKFSEMKAVLIEKLKQNERIKFNWTENSVPYILNLSVLGVKSEVMVNYLNSKGFLISAGSACSRRKPSRILINLGYLKQRQETAIRVSLSAETSLNQVESLAEEILIGMKKLNL